MISRLGKKFLITAAGGNGNKVSYQVFFGAECLFSSSPATVIPSQPNKRG